MKQKSGPWELQSDKIIVGAVSVWKCPISVYGIFGYEIFIAKFKGRSSGLTKYLTSCFHFWKYFIDKTSGLLFKNKFSYLQGWGPIFFSEKKLISLPWLRNKINSPYHQWEKVIIITLTKKKINSTNLYMVKVCTTCTLCYNILYLH